MSGRSCFHCDLLGLVVVLLSGLLLMAAPSRVGAADVQCTGDPFMKCFNQSTFVAVGQMSIELTAFLLESGNIDRNSFDFKNRTRTLSDEICKQARTTMDCLSARHFNHCEKQAGADEQAAIAIRFFQSFRYIYWGCDIWLNHGGSLLDSSCTHSVDNSIDTCEHVAPEVPLVRDIHDFFTLRSPTPGNAFNITLLPPISRSSCNAFKTRTGCLAAQFMSSCSSRIAEIPLMIARHQLHIGGTKPDECSFGDDDTASSVAQFYNSRTTLDDIFWFLATSTTTPQPNTTTTTPNVTSTAASTTAKKTKLKPMTTTLKQKKVVRRTTTSFWRSFDDDYYDSGAAITTKNRLISVVAGLALAATWLLLF